MAQDHQNLSFSWARWQGEAERLKAQYASNSPFPHVCLENFLDSRHANQVVQDLSAPGSGDWIGWHHFNENKRGKNRKEDLPASVNQMIDELNSPHFLAWLSELTGIPGLLADPMLDGAGIHESSQGGFLNVHADFTGHHFIKNWHRRINLLIYFNPQWNEEWGGDLELWDAKVTQCVKKYAPTFNRAIIFSTDLESYHGHPSPLMCPENHTRRSLALYYYTIADSHYRYRSTFYVGLPDDSPVKKILIIADRMALAIYSQIKMKFNFSDRWMGNFLRRLFGKHK